MDRVYQELRGPADLDDLYSRYVRRCASVRADAELKAYEEFCMAAYYIDYRGRSRWTHTMCRCGGKRPNLRSWMRGRRRREVDQIFRVFARIRARLEHTIGPAAVPTPPLTRDPDMFNHLVDSIISATGCPDPNSGALDDWFALIPEPTGSW